MAKSRSGKARPEARHFVDRERNDGELGFPYTQSAEIESGPAEAHRSAMQVDLVEAGDGLTRRHLGTRYGWRDRHKPRGR